MFGGVVDMLPGLFDSLALLLDFEIPCKTTSAFKPHQTSARPLTPTGRPTHLCREGRGTFRRMEPHRHSANALLRCVGALVVALLLPLTIVVPAARAAVVEYNLTISYGFWSPDCVQKQVYLINGQYPGPTITAVRGDTVVVRVTNKLFTEGVSIHWHGIRHLNNNLMDGAAYITQCPIQPLETMTYRFLADKAGTYMYHSHLNMQSSAGLYGSLIVKDSPTRPFPHKYNGELSLILTDWYHRSVQEMLAGLEAVPTQWIDEPQSILFNGRGMYNCSKNVPAGFNPVHGNVKQCNASHHQCGHTVFEVERGKVYRFRIISIATLASINLAFQGHNVTVVAADAYTVQPFVVGSQGLDVFTGQNVDVLIKADQPVGNYWIRASMIGYPPPLVDIGLAIIRYKGALQTAPTATPPAARAWDSITPSYTQAVRYKALLASAGGDTPNVPKTRNATRMFFQQAMMMVGDHLRVGVNNISFVHPSTPYALGLAVKSPLSLVNAIKEEYKPGAAPVPFKQWDIYKPFPTQGMELPKYYKIPLGTTVDLVMQNTNTIFEGFSEFHPWHMHGHHFWVLGYGTGLFNWTTHAPTFNLVNPPYRYTFNSFPYGWVAIRFQTDNPGAWVFHCHISAHLHLGMAIILINGDQFTIPPNTRKCGLLY